MAGLLALRVLSHVFRTVEIVQDSVQSGSPAGSLAKAESKTASPKTYTLNRLIPRSSTIGFIMLDDITVSNASHGATYG